MLRSSERPAISTFAASLAVSVARSEVACRASRPLKAALNSSATARLPNRNGDREESRRLAEDDRYANEKPCAF